jgi:hypothetical protein
MKRAAEPRGHPKTKEGTKVNTSRRVMSREQNLIGRVNLGAVFNVNGASFRNQKFNSPKCDPPGGVHLKEEKETEQNGMSTYPTPMPCTHLKSPL